MQTPTPHQKHTSQICVRDRERCDRSEIDDSGIQKEWREEQYNKAGREALNAGVKCRSGSGGRVALNAHNPTKTVVQAVIVLNGFGGVGFEFGSYVGALFPAHTLHLSAYESYGDDDESTGGGSDDGSDTQVPSYSESIRDHGAQVFSMWMQSQILRSLPSAWSQVSLIMRTKPEVDSLSFDDLYNNLRVFENDLDEFDLEEMELKWQVAMISMRMKKFYKKTDRKLQFDAKKPNSGNKYGRRSGKQEDSKALVTIDGEDVYWTSHSEEEEDYALMACNNSECKKSYAKLKKLYDAQREQLSDASIEIKAYTQGLKKVEAQLVAHQQGQIWYEEKIRFMKIDLDDKTDVLRYHKKLLAEAQKEKEDLKAKVEKWHNSSKNLDCSVKTHESLPEPTVNEPKVVNQPKVWSDAPIIEEYESDSEDEHVSQPTKEQEQPSFASTNKQVKTHRETVKNQFTYSKNPTVDKKGLGYGFTARACFVCGSLSHLIRDCDFHEKRMAKQAELNNSMKSSQREIRPIWNNAVLTNAAMKVNTVKPIVNRVRPANLVLLGEKGKLPLSPQQVVIGDKKDITGKISQNTIVDRVLEIVSLSKIH
ncbi:hypothetical protein Tco_0767663 [Tanacetum coccineum]